MDNWPFRFPLHIWIGYKLAYSNRENTDKSKGVQHVIEQVKMAGMKYHPRAGQILVCDFQGFKVPEMVKVRPVMVISPRLPYRSDIAAIVPISTTPPQHDLPFVVRLSKCYHPQEADNLPCWAKCDMVMNLGVWRLNGFKVDRRKYVIPVASPEDLAAVKQGVLYGLKLHD